MHRLFMPPGQLGDGQRQAPSRIALTAEQARHLETVLRLEPGAEIEIFDGQGARFRAILLEKGALRLAEAVPEDPSRSVDVVLVQALSKGEKMDLVVQKATELGASRIVPLSSERAVVRLSAERGGSRATRWRRVAQEAARQCGRADVPRIDEPLGWDGVLALLREEPARRGLLLDPEETRLRLGAAARGAGRVLLAVGPEGGFSPDERKKAREGGMLCAGLGPLVLRTETAGLAALSIVLHVHGELG
jgi:16S rRNA (uracil1498-N3)-methyltransferase